MSRVSEHIKVKASSLIPNPRNWRIHSPEQEGVMREIIDRLGGMAGSVHAYYSKRYGGLTLIDGHMRRELAGNGEIDVEVLDVNDEEADLLLATFDPVSDMATRDDAMLQSVLDSIDLTGLDEMLAGLDSDVTGMLGNDRAIPETKDNTYTNKIVAPVYEPKGERPAISQMIDRTKTDRLISQIDASSIPEDVKQFMRYSAERHTVFHFRHIAEYYCHASAELQDLMERSGMVIIDFNKAIEYGFVHLTERLGRLADLEEDDNADA